MAMVVNHNIPALQTYNVVNNTSSALQKSINKLSTGLRINSAADDAAGLAISEKMRAQVRGLDQAVSNSQDGISMIQTAEGALSETHSILQRMRELSVQAANDTLTQQDRGYIQEEVDQLREEITRIGNTTQFNKKKLLNGDAAVLWSSDNLETKAVVNGGLRTIDQFGQKSSAEGNYKINIKAVAGQGEVQKTDLMKIKHDTDFGIQGTSKFDGAALEGEASVEGIGNRQMVISVGSDKDDTATYKLTLTVAHDLSNDGLADAINAAVAKASTATADTDTLTSLGDTFQTDNIALTATQLKASTDSNGNLVLTNTTGGSISVTAGASTNNAGTANGDDLEKLLGAADETTALKAQHYEQTITITDSRNAAAQRTAWTGFTDGGTDEYKVKITTTGDTTGFEVGITDGDLEDYYTNALTEIQAANGTTGNAATTAEQDAAVAAAKTATLNKIAELINAETADHGVSASYADGKLTLTSDTGKVTLENDTTNALMTTALGMNDTALTTNQSMTNTTYTNADFTSKTFGAYDVNATNVVDTSKMATDFGKNMVGAKFDITVGDGTAQTIEIGKAGGTIDQKKTAAAGRQETYIPSIDDVVADIKEQIQANDALKDKVGVAKTEDGTGIRILAVGSDDLTLEALSDDDASKGTLDALFGTLKDVTAEDGTKTVTVTDTTATDGVIDKVVVKATEKSGTLNEVLGLDRDYSFVINDTEGNELAAVKLNGPFDSADDLAAKINAQIAKADDAGDIKATVIKGDDGSVSVALYSASRDFALANGSDVNTDPANGDVVYGYEDILGTGTTNDAQKNAVDGINTIGDVANKLTKLRDLEKFWDSEGNFMLEDPQTLTLTQGDGKQATITLYENDTLGSMAQKINNAIRDNLGQGQYLASTDAAGTALTDAEMETAQNSFATFVDAASADDKGNPTNTSEAVAGTMLIRSIAPGSSGTISFSGNEALINALSLNTIQHASETQYTVNISDAHSGETVVKDAKITGNTLVGALHPNVDVEFDKMSGIEAVWNDTDKKFEYKDSSNTKEADGSAKSATTFLHLSDNTTVFQIGANEGEDMGINIGDMRAHALGLDEVNVTNRERAARSITVIDNAIDKVSMQRSKLGAYQNRLEHTINNLTTASENLTAAESRIRDTDMAKEMMNFSKLQIMLQAGNSMLAQANQLPQNVLSLVR